MSTRKTVWPVVAAATLCSLWISAPAVAQDHDNVVRFGLGWYTTLGDADDIAENALAMWVGYERRFSEKLGFEGLTAYADYDPVINLFDRDIELTPLLASVNYYVKSSEKVEVYIAPTIGWGRLEIERGSSTDSDSGLVWGAAAGVDIPFGEGTGFIALSARYLTLSLDAAEFGTTSDIDFDNAVFHAGFGRRF